MSAAAPVRLPHSSVPVLNSNPAVRQGIPQDPTTAVMNRPWYLALQQLVASINSGGTGGFTAGGDLSGTPTVQIVIGLQGNPIDPTAPASGQVLEWNGSLWTPTTPSVVPGAIITDVHNLTTATTNIVASVLPAPANGFLAVKLTQDATGGRQWTWDATSFLFAPSGGGVLPNARMTFLFTADVASGKWEQAAPPMVH